MLLGLPYWLILVFPLAGSLLVPVVGRFSEKLRDWTPAIFMGIAMLLCWSLLPEIGHPTQQTSWTWIDVLGLNFEVLLDPLSVVMGVLASTLCFLIYVYSTEYMAHEEDRDRFFFLMLAFGGGMLTLVLSNNLLIAFIGWEIMGFCSYGLIGFWNDKRNPMEVEPDPIVYKNPLLQFETEGQYNTHCGTKAFVVTRIGDAFMLGGILILFLFTGTFSFTEMAGNAQGWWQVMAGIGMLVPTFLLIFMGAIGKSGQAPLQVWLPEAMAGPTSVSALIHAATMVKAGIYITARFLVTMVGAAGAGGGNGGHLTGLQAVGFEAAITFFIIVAVIGGITALLTATMGMVSNELKQILAFSTLSQLGYMMLSLGVGGILQANDLHYDHAYLSSVLHVVSHGAFKALLFLASGGVIHAVHTKYISKMGGLRKYMRKTFIVMWVGVLALAGIPPFSGFWSKDSIIEYTYELAAHWVNPLGWVLFGFAVLAAACTIFYSLRLMGITFYGPPKQEHDTHDSQETHDTHAEESEEQAEAEEEHHDEHHSEPHDPGPAMMIPLYILAAFTVIAFVVFPFIQNIVLETDQSWAETMTEMIMVKLTMPGIVPFAITLSALAIGGISGYIIYIKNADRPNTIIPESGFRRKLHNFLKHRWYINEFYYWVLDKFLNFTEWYRVRVDNNIIDGIDFKSADSARTISRKLRWFDDNVVDGFAEGISTQSVSGSERSQSAQTGRVNDYVGVVMFGIGLLVILALITMGVI
ncbi:MAG: NADH-quinone oxidoreductase subunit 5 family protein [Candidatus Thorarchaeota archaeon]|jgi:NADH-quinone oxidoreductase subunit L